MADAFGRVVDALLADPSMAVIGRFLRDAPKQLQPARATVGALEAAYERVRSAPSDDAMVELLAQVAEASGADCAGRGWVLVHVDYDDWRMLLLRHGRVRWLCSSLAWLIDALPSSEAAQAYEALHQREPTLARREPPSSVAVVVPAAPGVVVDVYGRLPGVDLETGETWRDAAVRACCDLGMFGVSPQDVRYVTTRRDDAGCWTVAALVRSATAGASGHTCSLPFEPALWPLWCWVEQEAGYADDKVWIHVLPDGIALIHLKWSLEWLVAEEALAYLRDQQVASCLVFAWYIYDKDDPREIRDAALPELAAAGLQRVALALEDYCDFANPSGDTPLEWSFCESPEQGLHWLRNPGEGYPIVAPESHALRAPEVSPADRLRGLARQHETLQRTYADELECLRRWEARAQQSAHAGVGDIAAADASLVNRLGKKVDACRADLERVEADIESLDAEFVQRARRQRNLPADIAFDPPRTPTPAHVTLDLELKSKFFVDRLPHRVLVVGDFTGRCDARPVEDRRCIELSAETMASVLDARGTTVERAPAWLAARHFVRATPSDVQTYILNCSKADLVMDVEEAPHLFKAGLRYAANGLFSTHPDLLPFGLIVFDYTLMPTKEDMLLIDFMGSFATTACVPVLTGASAEFVREPPLYMARWLETEAACWVGLCPGHVDTTDDAGQRHRINAAFAVALRIADSMSRLGSGVAFDVGAGKDQTALFADRAYLTLTTRGAARAAPAVATRALVARIAQHARALRNRTGLHNIEDAVVATDDQLKALLRDVDGVDAALSLDGDRCRMTVTLPREDGGALTLTKYVLLHDCH